MIEEVNERLVHRDEDGYSVIELLIIAAVVVILTGLSVFTLAPQQRAYRTDDAAGQITNFMRDAYHRALSQRQTMRVQVDRSNMVVTITDEGTLPGGDEVEVRRAKLSNEISVNQPTVSSALLNPPAAPYNYAVATYTTNIWTARFRSDGSVVDTAGNSMSATLFVSVANMKTTETNLIRAITVFGPSGSIRVWRYNGASFDAGAN